MIVDTSALIAIARGEPEAASFSRVLAGAQDVRISAGTLLEAHIVIDAMRHPVASRRFDAVIASVDPVIEPFTAEQLRIAREAYRDYGKGSGHPARLNFGNCFSYALASATRQPLLFKGDDFVHTDLTPAVTTR